MLRYFFMCLFFIELYFLIVLRKFHHTILYNIIKYIKKYCIKTIQIKWHSYIFLLTWELFIIIKRILNCFL